MTSFLTYASLAGLKLLKGPDFGHYEGKLEMKEDNKQLVGFEPRTYSLLDRTLTTVLHTVPHYERKA